MLEHFGVWDNVCGHVTTLYTQRATPTAELDHAGPTGGRARGLGRTDAVAKKSAQAPRLTMAASGENL